MTEKQQDVNDAQDGYNVHDTRVVRDISAIVHNSKLILMIFRFIAFIKTREGVSQTLDFQDDSFYFANENYKSKTAKAARETLQYENWTEEWIRDGRILDCVRKAVKCDENLIYPIQRTALLHKIDPNQSDYNPQAACVLYNFYKSEGADAEAAALNEAVGVFGRYYDIISYLFFIKDPKRFLPVSPGNYENSLESVGIKHDLSGQCSWENYHRFIEIMSVIRNVMQEILPHVDIRLIDAHTFLWVIHKDREGKKDKQYDDFLNWEPDAETDAQIETYTERFLNQKATGADGKESRLSSYYVRNAEVVRITKERAKGVCELCRKPAPFNDSKGAPYLEAHHIVWLSRGGADSTDNTAALCPNCHTKMHVVDDEADVEKLKSLRNE